MTVKIYPWDTKQQQAQTQPYGFMDFPPDFLQTYRASRDKVIKFLEQSYNPKDTAGRPVQLRFPQYCKDESTSADKILDSEIPVYSAEDLESSNHFETKKSIRTLYKLIYQKKPFGFFELQHFMRILKKAELKLLKTSYNKDFINTSKQNLDLEDYAYLALTLGLYAKTGAQGHLQALSTALKINDFLVSQSQNFSSSLEKILTLVSLNLEKELIEKLIKLKGLAK